LELLKLEIDKLQSENSHLKHQIFNLNKNNSIDDNLKNEDFNLKSKEIKKNI
jgi:hypothetical protein